MSKVEVFIQFQFVMIISVPSLRKMKRGRRLTKNAVFTVVLTWEVAHSGVFGFGLRVVRIGRVRRTKTRIRLEAKINVLECIATAWICTKSFWYLRPTDDCYPSVALGRGEPRDST